MADRNNIADFLKDHYEDNGSKWCAERLDLTEGAVGVRAWRMGLNKRAKRRELVERRLRENYGRLPTEECAEELGMSAQKVRTWASKLGFAGRRKNSAHSNRVNARFFDGWTEESAYVLGFLYADGNIRRDRVTFYQKEREILDEIREKMGIVNEVCRRKCGGDGYTLSFNNPHLVDRLRRIGVRDAKSTTGEMVFPEVPEWCFCHFFRGFFDGDGSVGIYGKWDNCRVSLFGPRMWVERMKQTVDEMLGLKGGGVRRASSDRDDFCCCSWGARREVKRLCDWMYEGATVFLGRKRDVFDRAFVS